MSETSYLKWKDIYSVGNKDLDDQHKYMFALLSEIYDSLQEGASAVPIAQLVERARLYGKLHFETEEKVMADCGYPHLKEHRARHEEYCGRVDQMTLKTGPDTTFELFVFLKDWWVEHITQLDADYAKWIARCAGGPAKGQARPIS